MLAREEATGDRKYGLWTVWVKPSQARVPSMEEAVGKLTAWTSSGPNWPYALVQLHKGTCHAPLPKEGHLGIPPWRGAEANPCGQISQLEVCQLLVTSTQVTCPIGLNGCNNPIITSLLEPLAYGANLTAVKPVYLEIDIPPFLVEEPDQKVLPVGKVSTIIVASLHKSTPLKSEGEGSMTMEVRNLLSWTLLEMSGCGSKNSTPRRSTPMVIPVSLHQKSKELLQPVDTSSQASTEIAETSLEGIPTSISPIVVASWSGSVTTPADAMDLQENANKALEVLLTTKASTDAHRWRAVWELGMELHWNESQVTESIKETKAICCWVTLDAKTTCSGAVKEAKVTWDHIIQEAKVACSTAIRDVEARRACQAESLQREHGNIIWDLETQVIWEECRSQASFLSACQATLYTSWPELKSTLAISYHILLGQIPPSPPFVLSQRASPVGEQPTSSAPLHQWLSSLLGPKDGTLHQILLRACLWVEPLWMQLWEDPQLQVKRDPTPEQSTQAKPCRGIWPGLWLGKGGQEGILLKTFLQLHHGGHPQSLGDISADGHKHQVTGHLHPWNPGNMDGTWWTETSQLYSKVFT